MLIHQFIDQSLSEIIIVELFVNKHFCYKSLLEEVYDLFYNLTLHVALLVYTIPSLLI